MRAIHTQFPFSVYKHCSLCTCSYSRSTILILILSLPSPLIFCFSKPRQSSFVLCTVYTLIFVSPICMGQQVLSCIHLMKGFFSPETGSVLDRFYILLLHFSVTLSYIHEYTEFRPDLSCEKYYLSSRLSNYFAGMKARSWREHAVQGPSFQTSSSIVAGVSSTQTLGTRCQHHFGNADLQYEKLEQKYSKLYSSEGIIELFCCSKGNSTNLEDILI